MTSVPNCWEIMNCGREAGGANVPELGECVASKEQLGHSCWMLAGTLCRGVVQGTFAQKAQGCLPCEVYKTYNRGSGTRASEVVEAYPDENARYRKILLGRALKRS